MTTTSTDDVLVFSYGSNMLTARIRERCPGAQAIGTALLEDHQLAWHKSSKNGSGKCDVVGRRRGAAVHGVVFRVPRAEKWDLDKAEGLGYGYDERVAEVILNGERSRVVLYVATDTDGTLKSYTWYRALVVAGAREHGLPSDYITALETVEALEDQDRSRHDKNMLLALGATTR